MYAPTLEAVLCEKAQNEFDTFCTIPMVPVGQLYGGKICAALSRQHPRDLFDVKFLLDNEGFSEEIKKGFLLCLLGGDRPIHEIISPNILDQRSAIANQFEGMTEERFTYNDFEETLFRLISTVQENLTEYDKEFLLSVQRLSPDWSLYPYKDFPSVRWKLMNLKTLRERNGKKYRAQNDALEKALLRN